MDRNLICSHSWRKNHQQPPPVDTPPAAVGLPASVSPHVGCRLFCLFKSKARRPLHLSRCPPFFFLFLFFSSAGRFATVWLRIWSLVSEWISPLSGELWRKIHPAWGLQRKSFPEISPLCPLLSASALKDARRLFGRAAGCFSTDELPVRPPDTPKSNAFNPDISHFR